MSFQTRITAAAIWDKKSGQAFWLPPPARHHDIIKSMTARGYSAATECVQGFMTNTGSFVDRKVAAKIATAADQIIEVVTDGIPMQRQDVTTLFSEDLW
jgi:hypothetical protein